MTVKILISGHANELVYTRTCPHCRCMFSFNKTDGNPRQDLGNEFFQIRCPSDACRQMITTHLRPGDGREAS